jgi:hypothetical protein
MVVIRHRGVGHGDLFFNRYMEFQFYKMKDFWRSVAQQGEYTKSINCNHKND